MNYRVEYPYHSRAEGWRSIPATLRAGSRPGSWAIWSDDPSHPLVRHAWLGSNRTARALESGISTAAAARRFPKHADALLATRADE